MPRVTILLPMRNVAPYVGEAVDSLLSQEFRDFELLILDDASTDESVAVVGSRRDDRIRLVKNETRLKLAGALNRGLDLARGEYVARMDADDISCRERLGRQVGFLDAHPDIGICGTSARTFGVRPHRTYREPSDHPRIKAKTLFDTPFVHPTVMIRRAALAGNRYDVDFYPTEDFELWSRMIWSVTGANLPDVLLRYRVHAESMTGAEWTDMDRQACRIVRRSLDRLGLGATDEAAAFHRKIGRGRSYSCGSLEELGRADAWLRRLAETNERTAAYDREALRSEIADVWFRTCLASTHLGWTVVREYRRRRIPAGDAAGQRTAVMVLSAIRRLLAATRSPS